MLSYNRKCIFKVGLYTCIQTCVHNANCVHFPGACLKEALSQPLTLSHRSNDVTQHVMGVLLNLIEDHESRVFFSMNDVRNNAF